VKRRAAKKLSEWAEIAGIKEADIVELAQEFTSHGKRAVADIHRVSPSNTSGFYNVLAWMVVNVLIGNHDWMGGLSKQPLMTSVVTRKGSHSISGKHEGKAKGWGVSIIRHETAYDTKPPSSMATLPSGSGILSVATSTRKSSQHRRCLPYPIKALLLYMGSPVYALPAGHKLVEILSDPKKLPLIIVSDIVVGETSMYADYIFPTSPISNAGSLPDRNPSVTPKVAPIRPTRGRTPYRNGNGLWGKDAAFPGSLLLGIAEKMKLPGFGDNAFGPGRHLKREEICTFAWLPMSPLGDKADGSEKVPAASAEEIKIFEQAGRHLRPPSLMPTAGKRWSARNSGPTWSTS